MEYGKYFHMGMFARRRGCACCPQFDKDFMSSETTPEAVAAWALGWTAANLA